MTTPAVFSQLVKRKQNKKIKLLENFLFKINNYKFFLSRIKVRNNAPSEIVKISSWLYPSIVC